MEEPWQHPAFDCEGARREGFDDFCGVFGDFAEGLRAVEMLTASDEPNFNGA